MLQPEYDQQTNRIWIKPLYIIVLWCWAFRPLRCWTEQRAMVCGFALKRTHRCVTATPCEKRWRELGTCQLRVVNVALTANRYCNAVHQSSRAGRTRCGSHDIDQQGHSDRSRRAARRRHVAFVAGAYGALRSAIHPYGGGATAVH